MSTDITPAEAAGWQIIDMLPTETKAALHAYLETHHE